MILGALKRVESWDVWRPNPGVMYHNYLWDMTPAIGVYNV